MEMAASVEFHLAVLLGHCVRELQQKLCSTLYCRIEKRARVLVDHSLIDLDQRVLNQLSAGFRAADKKPRMTRPTATPP